LPLDDVLAAYREVSAQSPDGVILEGALELVWPLPQRFAQ
jgi:hypothetical protein